jgi:hypothetical protein
LNTTGVGAELFFLLPEIQDRKFLSALLAPTHTKDSVCHIFSYRFAEKDFSEMISAFLYGEKGDLAYIRGEKSSLINDDFSRFLVVSPLSGVLLPEGARSP